MYCIYVECARYYYYAQKQQQQKTNKTKTNDSRHAA